MSHYLFAGRLRAALCHLCHSDLAGVQVRLYRHRQDQDSDDLAKRPAKELFRILSEKEVAAKQEHLLAEVNTDADGRFEVGFGDDAGYQGGPFEIDVRLHGIPDKPSEDEREPLQFTVTSLAPEWEQGNDRLVAAPWDHTLAARYWCHILARFDVWVICGRFVTCEGKHPLPGATVRAFDADFTQHDSLGEALTDANGRFRIYYTSKDFKKTPWSPVIDLELIGGPDLFFQVEYGGTLVINESASAGRTPTRENVGHCACVELCSDELAPPDADQIPHWERVEAFEVDTDFSPEGYAGSGQVVMSDGIDLHGNMPLVNAVTGNPLKYRFLVGAWGWPGGTESPGIMPSLAPTDADLVPVTALHASRVGYIYYTDGNGDSRSAPVYVRSSDLDGDGCVSLLDLPVTVDMHDGTTATVNVSTSNFIGAYLLMTMNSLAITPPPYDTVEDLGRATAGTAVPVSAQAPIRRYELRFQVFDRDQAVDQSSSNKTLDALVIDNSPVKYALNLSELASNLCNPISTDVHILYTIDHPHLRSFRVTIESNNGLTHGAPPLPSGSFSGDYFFRGGANGPTGAHVDVSGDPSCAYAVKLSWHTRHYHGSRGSSRHVQLLYCK
ncbi:hypothetical protein [Haliangium sp.]|uniref:hypothetical protein n=1 Tax=Haliangium sp. TaxID=2663208 RepID=UPI003D13CBC7